ncbi:MAG: hypothetical protein CVT49_10440 [candidate division Zixibacteria bacterium HGW-Zixibacteria-1]|nr:MAG: hypothetical protein CVT49_10440 [candidate division Zixibacteria bacterium HGW-Zixibacteria-1]
MKLIIYTIVSLALLAGIALPQEVIIADFPLGVGGSVNKELFQPYMTDLKAISDTLQKYPLARAIVTGGSDGNQYRENHDAKNPSLALGRAHILRNLLINEFKVDSTQIIIQSNDSQEKAARFRYAGIRVDMDLQDISSRLANVENRPPIEKHFTEVKEVPGSFTENLGLQLCLGVSSSPFGGIPTASGILTYKQFIHAEGIVGHTFWNGTFDYYGQELDTRRRLVGGNLIIFPYENLPVGILGGWVHIEEISQDYYEYVKLSEGPLLGLRAYPFKFLSVTGAYNPSMHRRADDNKSRAKNGQFLFAVSTHIAFGGAR